MADSNRMPRVLKKRLESARANSDVASFLSFDDWIGLEDFKRTDWIAVADFGLESRDGRKDEPYTFSFLVKSDSAKDLLAQRWDGFDADVARWNLLADYTGQERDDFQDHDTLTPFVLSRHFPGGTRPDTFELVQAFVIYYDAFESKDGGYQFFDDDGELQTLSRFSRTSNQHRRLEINAHFLRRFLAANSSVLMRFHAHDRSAAQPISVADEGSVITSDSERWYQVQRGNNQHQALSPEVASIGHLIGKDLVRPYDSAEEPPEPDHLFIIGVADDGTEVEETCDPELLSNYFTDKGKPHYLTDVFFDPKVLKKYYDEPSRYSVEDGLIRCLDRWLLRSFERTNEGLIHVWLGDLHSLPVPEQKHWRLFNVRPTGSITASRFERDFEGNFANPENDPVFYFRVAYNKLHDAFQAKFQLDILLPLDSRDQYVLGSLHVPVTDEWPESDSQIGALAKIVPDSINLRFLKDVLSSEVLQELETAKSGSIRHLQAWLVQIGLSESAAADCVRALDAVQNLRSSGAAHRKGKNFDKTSEKYGIADLSNSVGVERIITNLTISLNTIVAAITEK